MIQLANKRKAMLGTVAAVVGAMSLAACQPAAPTPPPATTPPTVQISTRVMPDPYFSGPIGNDSGGVFSNTLSDDGKYRLSEERSFTEKSRVSLTDGTRVALQDSYPFETVISGDGKTVIGSFNGGPVGSFGYSPVLVWKPDTTGGTPVHVGAASLGGARRVNSDGTLLLSEYRGSNGVSQSRVVDLRSNPVTVRPITEFLGTVNATTQPFAADVSGMNVVTLLVDATAPTTARYRTQNVATGAVTQGVIPFSCPIPNIKLSGAAAYCAAPGATTLHTFNTLTNTSRQMAMAKVDYIVKVTPDGRRAIAFDRDTGTGGAANLVLYSAGAPAKVITNNATNPLGVSTSAAGTAIVWVAYSNGIQHLSTITG
jgi:hypothetical protein